MPKFDYLEAMQFPLVHPEKVERDQHMDDVMGKMLTGNVNLASRTYRKVKSLFIRHS